MKYIFILFCVITTITSCKTREIISKELIDQYHLTDETLIGTEVYVTDPIRMVFDTTIQATNNRKGFISVSENKIIRKVNIRSQSKGLIKSVDYVGRNLLVGVLFKKKADPIYFSLNRIGVLQLVVFRNKVEYLETNYELVSDDIPYLEVIVKKNKRSSKSKVTMTGY